MQAKTPSFDMFLFLFLAVAAFGFWWTVEPDKRQPTTVLSRAMTEEWKGAMQLAILLYVLLVPACSFKNLRLGVATSASAITPLTCVACCRYHYFKVGEAYNLIRITITSYVWLTGFGHLMYFSARSPKPKPKLSGATEGATTRKASGTTTDVAAAPATPENPSTVTVVRFIQTVWRLNFLAVMLSLTMNNSYILYYICAVHTFQFLLVFGLMALGCV